MSQENIKKIGYLSKLPVKGLMKVCAQYSVDFFFSVLRVFFVLQKWSKRWFILHGTSHEGVVRIEYFDSQESAMNGIGKRTIPLRDSRDFDTAPGNKLHPYVFQFTSQIGVCVLSQTGLCMCEPVCRLHALC